MNVDFILDQMETAAEPFALCELHGRCDLALDKDPSATLHYVLAGHGEILLPDRTSITVKRGSLILVPALSRHTLRSFGGASVPVPACRPASLGMEHLIHGTKSDQDGRLIAVCSRVSLSLRNLHNLIDLVREPIAEAVGENRLLTLPVEGILREITEPGPGGAAMIRALLRVCFIEMMRRRLTTQNGGLRWMMALGDPRLWPALEAMLDNPGAAHSLESLAETAAMSRSGFAKRFTDAHGSGPMELLRDLRIQHALKLLIESDLPVKRIAERVGFRSRSAFTRAFEASIGLPPKHYRDQRAR